MNLNKKSFYILVLGLNFTDLFYFLIHPLLFLSYQDFWDFIHQAKNAPIVSLNHTFQKSLLLNVKIFLSRGILLFLTFWVSVYILLLIHWKGQEPFFRKLCLALVAALMTGTAGIYFHNQSKLIAYTPMEPAITTVVDQGDELKQIVKFNQFDEKFLKYLKEAASGKIRLSILNANTANEVQAHDMSRPVYRSLFKIGDRIVNSSMKNYLEPQHVTELLKTKKLSYIYKTIKGGYFYLYSRAAGNPVTCRNDTLTLNEKIIPVPADYLPLVFRFEDLSGKPLIAFY